MTRSQFAGPDHARRAPFRPSLLRLDFEPRRFPTRPSWSGVNPTTQSPSSFTGMLLSCWPHGHRAARQPLRACAEINSRKLRKALLCLKLAWISMPVYIPMRHASGSHRIDRSLHNIIVLSTSGTACAKHLRPCENHGERREFCCERLYVFFNIYGPSTMSRTAAVLARTVPYSRKLVEAAAPPLYPRPSRSPTAHSTS